MVRRRSVSRVVLSCPVRIIVTGALMAAVAFSGAPRAEAQAVPANRYVDSVYGSDTNGGTAEEPWRTIRYALVASGPEDTIIVQPGTYNATGGEIFPLTLRGSRKLVSYGYEPGAIIEGAAGLGILTIESITTGCQLSGFVFTGGTTLPAVTVDLTGTSGEALWLAGNRFSGNAAGALRATGDPVAADYVLPIYSNEFLDNTGGPGVLLDIGCGADIIGNTFSRNEAGRGAAVEIVNSGGQAVTVLSNTFEDNVGEGAWGGGALYVAPAEPCDLVLVENWFEGNTCVGGGAGALLLSSANAVISRNVGMDNTALTEGGFAALGNADVTAENNWFDGNSAGNMGGTWYVHEDSSLVERNDTVTGGIGVAPAASAHDGGFMSITNSIYWNPALATDITGADSLSYSCVYDPEVAHPDNDNTIGSGMIDQDPMFHAADGAPALAKTSPCIDAAGTSEPYPAVDLYVTHRPQDGDHDGSALPDIGCYEYVYVPPLPVYRFYNPRLGVHFYTANETEKNSVIDTLGGTYTFEGTAYSLNPAANSQPLHRFYNRLVGVHFYTASETEKANVQATLGHIYTYEGVAYNVSMSPAVGPTAYRFYRPSTGTHFYTASETEKANVQATLGHIFTYEGPAFYLGQ